MVIFFRADQTIYPVNHVNYDNNTNAKQTNLYGNPRDVSF